MLYHVIITESESTDWTDLHNTLTTTTFPHTCLSRKPILTLYLGAIRRIAAVPYRPFITLKLLAQFPDD